MCRTEAEGPVGAQSGQGEDAAPKIPGVWGHKGRRASGEAGQMSRALGTQRLWGQGDGP